MKKKLPSIDKLCSDDVVRMSVEEIKKKLGGNLI